MNFKLIKYHLIFFRYRNANQQHLEKPIASSVSFKWNSWVKIILLENNIKPNILSITTLIAIVMSYPTKPFSSSTWLTFFFKYGKLRYKTPSNFQNFAFNCIYTNCFEQIRFDTLWGLEDQRQFYLKYFA